MKRSDRHLSRIVALARRAAPQPDEPMSPDDARFFSQSTATVWSRHCREATPPDPLRLWERVGAWSLAASMAVVLLVTALSSTAREADPFAPWVEDEAEETLFF